jgi:hypothetical protein
MGIFDGFLGGIKKNAGFVLMDLATDILGHRLMKKSHDDAEKKKTEGAKGGEKKGDDKVDEAKRGGHFTYDDEIAYANLLSRFGQSTEPTDHEIPVKVAAYHKAKLNIIQQQRFRVVVGAMVNKEFVVGTKETVGEKITDEKTQKTTEKMRDIEVKANAGVEFLRALGRLYPDYNKMHALVESVGILHGEIDFLKAGLSHGYRAVDQGLNEFFASKEGGEITKASKKFRDDAKTRLDEARARRRS